MSSFAADYDRRSVPTPALVVTYRLAYVDQQVTLCATCSNPALASSYPHPLGPVQHRGHAGRCQHCRRTFR